MTIISIIKMGTLEGSYMNKLELYHKFFYTTKIPRRKYTMHSWFWKCWEDGTRKSELLITEFEVESSLKA